VRRSLTLPKPIAPSRRALSRSISPLILRVLSACALAAPCALASLAATEGIAEAQQSSSVVVYIEGQNAEATRDEVLSILPSGVRAADESQFTDELKKAGHKGQVGNTIAIAKQRGKLVERIGKATKSVGAAGAIIGRIRRTRTGGREVYLIYVKPTGELTVDEAVPLAASGDARKSALKGALDRQLSDVAPPEPTMGTTTSPPPGGSTEGGGEDEKKDDDKPAWDRVKNEPSTAIAIVDVAYQTGGRFFAYSDGLTSNLRPYDVFGPPGFRVAAEVYPAGLAGDVPVAKDIGLTVSYAMAIGLKSATEGGEPLSTSWNRLGLGLRGRFRFGEEAPSAMLGVSAGFHMLNFKFAAKGELAAEVPEVAYKLLRFGLDTRIPLGPVALELDGAFLLPLSSGAVYDRFTDPSVLGVEGRAGVAVPIALGFEARLMGEYTRFFSAFKPVPGDPYVAGGALDQLIAIRLGAAYAY
jgi:hypothetical protein